MILNTFQTNLKRKALRGLAGLLCLVCGILASPLAHAAEAANTIAITFNGYDGAGIPDFSSMQKVNLDCSNIKADDVAESSSASVISGGIKFTLMGYVDSDAKNSRVFTPLSGGGILMCNQKFSITLQDDQKIKGATAYYGTQNNGLNLGKLYKGADTTNGLLDPSCTFSGTSSSANFCCPYKTSAVASKYGVCLQALVIEYEGGDNGPSTPDAPKTEKFTVPANAGVDVVSIMNGTTAVDNGANVEVGTKLTVTLKPSSADDVIKTVTYGGTAVNGTTDADGNWTGTIEVAEGATLSVETAKKEVSFTMATIGHATVTVMNGTTKVTSGNKLPIGTLLDVTIKPSEVKYFVNEVKYGDNIVSGSTASDDTWTGAIEVAEGAILSAVIDVKTFSVSANTAYVTFVNPNNGVAIEDADAVPYGTTVGIKVDGYPNTQEIASVACKDAAGNDVPLGKGTTYCANTVVVTANLTIEVNFQDKNVEKAEVSFPQVNGGTISVSDGSADLANPAYVAPGTKIIITLTPDDGYAVGELIVDGKTMTSELDANNMITYTIPDGAGAVAIQASFVKTYKVTWTAPEAGLGSMTVKNQNDVEITSGTSEKSGEKLTITLTPTQGDMITSLTANGSTVKATGTANVYSVTVTADTELVPYIGKELKNYNLGIQGATGGTIRIWDNATMEGNAILMASGASSPTAKAIKEGTPLYGTVTVATDYVLESLQLTNVGDVVFSSMDENRVVTFSFNMPPRATNLVPTYTRIMPERTVTVTVPEAQAGMGNVSYKIGDATNFIAYSEPFKAKQGDVITFNITATDGNRITSVSPSLNYTKNTDTEKVGTLTVGTSNPTLTVNFSVIPKRAVTISGLNLTTLPEGIDGLSATFNGSPVVFGETEIPEGGKIEFTLKAKDEYELTSFKVGNTDGTVEPDGTTANATYLLPNNTTNIAISYTVRHRTTNITFRLNNTEITNMGSVVATYKAGNNTVTLQPNTATQTQSVPTATPVSVVVTPKTGYMVETLEINGVSVDLTAEGVINASTRVVTATGYYTTPSAVSGGSDELEVYVTFKEVPVYYSLSITATGGKVEDKDKPLEVEYGTVTYTSTGDLSDLKKVLKDTKVTITVKPAVNYQIKSITVNGQALDFDIVASMVEVPLTITQNTTVAVVFEARTYRVQVFASPALGGEPYISTQGVAVQSFKSGSQVTIYAPVNPGYKFVKWMLNGQDVMNGTALAGATYSFTMPQADQRFTAVYEEIKYTPHSVRIQVAEGQEKMGTIGIIYPSSTVWTSWNQTSVYIQGWDQYVEVKATANTAEAGRYYFDSWQVSGAASGTVTQTTADDNLSSIINYGGNNNVTITAKFGIKYKVTVKAPVNGTIEVVTSDGIEIRPNSDLFVKPGTRVTVTMTSNRGYNVATLAVNESETTHYNRPGTFSQTVTINSDTSLNALFYNPNGIDDIAADGEEANEPEQWFTVQGQYLGTQRPTAPGLYIRRAGTHATKIVIR